MISENMSPTPMRRNVSWRSSSGSDSAFGSSRSTCAAMSFTYVPAYPSSGTGSPFAAAISERTNRSIWAPASLK